MSRRKIASGMSTTASSSSGVSDIHTIHRSGRVHVLWTRNRLALAGHPCLLRFCFLLKYINTTPPIVQQSPQPSPVSYQSTTHHNNQQTPRSQAAHLPRALGAASSILCLMCSCFGEFMLLARCVEPTRSISSTP